MNQTTISKPVTVDGVDPLGGNSVRVQVRPARCNTGIVFRSWQNKDWRVLARIENLYPFWYTTILRDKDYLGKEICVAHVEHILATLVYGCNIDNANVFLDQLPRNGLFQLQNALGLATKTKVVPNFPDREYTLWNAVQDVGITEQDAERTVYTTDQTLGDGRLRFEPGSIEDGLVVEAVTNYAPIGEESMELTITPEVYGEMLARSRCHAKGPFLDRGLYVPQLANILVRFMHPEFGLGHGYNEDQLFFPVETPEAWRQQERMKHEIVMHTMVDRLGAAAAVGRLAGKLYANGSGHTHDIDFFRRTSYKFTGTTTVSPSASQRGFCEGRCRRGQRIHGAPVLPS